MPSIRIMTDSARGLSYAMRNSVQKLQETVLEINQQAESILPYLWVGKPENDFQKDLSKWSKEAWQITTKLEELSNQLEQTIARWEAADRN